jgi:DNA replication protein DnaC
LRQLHRCKFLEDAHNVVLVGGLGTGKADLATAIGVQAIEHHRRHVSIRKKGLRHNHSVPLLFRSS